jgi:hypothetical protein
LQQIIGAMNAATSYRMHLAAAASAHSQEYAATIVYVAPDRSASVVDSDGLRFYTIAIGVTRYTSVDGKTWIAHPPLPGLPTGGFGLQVTPRQAVAMLPSDGSGLGGLQLRDPAAGQQFELRYDPQSFRLVSAVGEFPVDGGTQHLEIQFADYDNPSNTVTKPLP